jgi:hypothetical protein
MPLSKSSSTRMLLALPKTQRLATTTLEVCIPGDRTRPTRRPGSPLNLAPKSFRGWLPRSHGTVGGTNSYFHLMLGSEERLKICCRGDEGSPLRRMAASSSSRQKRRTCSWMTPRPAPTTTGAEYNCSDVFVRDRVKKTTKLVSVATR